MERKIEIGPMAEIPAGDVKAAVAEAPILTSPPDVGSSPATETPERPVIDVNHITS